jgi:hypothetical protein
VLGFVRSVAERNCPVPYKLDHRGPKSRAWFRLLGRSGGPNSPTYLNHMDARLGGVFGLNRPETLVLGAAMVQIRGTKPVMVQIGSALSQVARDGTAIWCCLATVKFEPWPVDVRLKPACADYLRTD